MLPPPNTPSFELVFTSYKKAIHKRIRRYIPDNSIACDLHQEVLIKIWKKLSSYDGTKGTLFAWIATITTNTCIDYLRTLDRRVMIREKTDVETEDIGLVEPDFKIHGELLWLTDKLSSSQKDVVIMIYFRGHTQSEVARLLKLPLGTVKTRQRSAIIALRKMYKNKKGN